MNRDEAQDRLRELQRIMERTTLLTLLPGTPAIVGGVLALIGCGVSYAMIRSLDFVAVLALPRSDQAWFYVTWGAVGLAAIVQHLVLMARAARRQQVAPIGRPGQLTALALTPNVLVAALLTANLLANGHMQYVAPIWMVCYGTGVYAAGLFSVRLPRLLGLGFILTGVAGLFALPRYGLLLTAVSFGLMHIVFGVLVIHRARRSRTE